MAFRKTPCPCGCRLISIDAGIMRKKYHSNGNFIVEEIYAEYCKNCSNLLYGHIKPLRTIGQL